MKIKMIKIIHNFLFTVILILPVRNTIYSNAVIQNKAFVESEKDNRNLSTQKIVLLDINNKYCDIECLIVQNKDTIEFFSKTFGTKSEYIQKDLIKINSNKQPIKNNIGRLKDKKGNLKQYNSFEEGLIEYLYTFAKKNPKLISNKIVPYSGKSEYIIDLMKYYVGIYNNVDYATAVSIGAAESGNYQVKYMLKYNNIYGGMGTSGLLKYKNIEYGVLSYIRMLSKNYYGQGLTTIEKIGQKYCPEYQTGNKIASQHWIKLVTSYLKKYNDTYEPVSITNLKMNKS